MAAQAGDEGGVALASGCRGEMAGALTPFRRASRTFSMARMAWMSPAWLKAWGVLPRCRRAWRW